MSGKENYSGGKLIKDWDIENKKFWEETGKHVANRNLLISVPALLLSFSVWLIWSIMVVKLPDAGFKFTPDQLLFLAALPPLSGATLRIFYSFMIPVFGGRVWTFITTLSLLIPAIGSGIAINNPNSSYELFVILALLSGLGGGNFASSMSNISYYFPKAKKGSALGINAGIGNLGVSVAQFFIPLVITFPLFGSLAGEGVKYTASNGEIKTLYLQNGAYFWVIFIVIISVFVWFGMNSLSTAKASVKDQFTIFKSKHNWLMCWLYIGTFGSFIGYSSAFPTVIKTQFTEYDPLKYAFLGPLVGAIFRPLGGIISDKLGGAKVTFWNFVIMGLAVYSVIYFTELHNFWGFFLSFMLLFITTGIGNGSTFRMVPIIYFNEYNKKTSLSNEQKIALAARDGATVLGFTSAIGAYGGFLIPKMFGYSIKNFGNLNTALYIFIIFYASCLLITFWYYYRKNAESPC